MKDRPKEGIYLDATLAVIGEQLEERIDALSRRRALRLRLGVAALAIATVASGSVAAVALTSNATDASPEASVSLTVPGEVHCVDGTDADRPAYFTARYRTAEEVEVDPVMLCGIARSAIATDDGTIEGAAPRELAGIAESLLLEAFTDDAPGEMPKADAVAVDAASFGVLSAYGGPHMIACTSDGHEVVFAAPYGDAPTLAERMAACAGAAE